MGGEIDVVENGLRRTEPRTRSIEVCYLSDGKTRLIVNDGNGYWPVFELDAFQRENLIRLLTPPAAGVA